MRIEAMSHGEGGGNPVQLARRDSADTVQLLSAPLLACLLLAVCMLPDFEATATGVRLRLRVKVALATGKPGLWDSPLSLPLDSDIAKLARMVERASGASAGHRPWAWGPYGPPGARG